MPAAERATAAVAARAAVATARAQTVAADSGLSETLSKVGLGALVGAGEVVRVGAHKVEIICDLAEGGFGKVYITYI